MIRLVGGQPSAYERGASSVEYGLLVAAIAALIAIVVWALGGLVQENYADTCSTLDAEMAATASC